MNALQSALVLRRRGGWEAADAGILLWRQNWIALLLFFGIPYGLLTLAFFLLPDEYLAAANGILWWLRPFFDRFALHVVSVRFFEPEARRPRLFRGLGKSLGRGLFGDLLWRRFSPWRSARMPLVVLEGLRGKALKRRREMLSPGGLYFGFPILLLCLILVNVLLYGEFSFLFGIFELIQPGFISGDFFGYVTGMGRLPLALLWFNQMFVETLFVCMGFSIYINARVETEGWDIELLFRDCIEKAKKSPQRIPAGTGISRTLKAAPPAVLIAVLALLSAPSKSFALPAEDTGKAEPLVIESLLKSEQETLDEVFLSEDFGVEKKGREIRFKEKPEGERLNLEWRKFDFPWIKEILGIAVRTILILAFIFALGFFARYFYLHREFFTPRKDRGKIRRKGGGGAEDPEDLLENAAALHAAGKIREAWALCLRAWLAAWTDRRGIIFTPETTEYEALRRTRQNDTGDFSRFVRAWINFAYGGKTPPEGGFAEAVFSCRRLLVPVEGPSMDAPHPAGTDAKENAP